MIRLRRVLAWGPRCYSTGPSNAGDAPTETRLRPWRLSNRFARAISGTTRPGTAGYESFETSRFGISPIPVEFYKFTHGSSTYRLTPADQTLSLAVVDVGSYTPDVIQRTELDFSQEDSAQNIVVTVPQTNAIALLFRAYTPTGKVALTIYRKHRSDAEERVVFVGTVISCVFEGAEAKLTCAPLGNAFQRAVPSILYQSSCNWSLYGAGCGVAKASFKTTGTVTAVSGSSIYAAAWATKPDGWFTNGWAEIASSGERRFIVAHVGSELRLMNPFASLAVGASIDAYAGCDRTEATCAAKFANLVNHLGFARIPARNPYGGGSLV